MPNSRHDALSNVPVGYREALAYLYGRIDYERAIGRRNDHPFRLEQTEELFKRLGLGSYLHHSGPETTPDPATPACSGSPPRSRQNPAGQNPPRQNPRRHRPPRVPLIHIAGTKGKGSTATMISGMLSAAGYRVGLYTSPHLTDLEERFRINGAVCSRESLVELVEIVSPIVSGFDSTADTVSFFELTTAMAVLYFDRNACDVIVMEVGLGGRLDSTNVCASTVAAITSIGLDHQRILGNSIAEIASEKAGIIKGGVPVVSGVTAPEATAVIRAAAARGGSRLFESGDAFEVLQPREVAVGSEFVYRASAAELQRRTENSEIPIFLGLDGGHQIHNAAVAISIARLLTGPLLEHPLSIGDGQITQALQTVQCSGRMERFRLAPPADPSSPREVRGAVQIIIDTAHNHDSIAALCGSVGRRKLDVDVASATIQPPEIGQFGRPIVAVVAVSRDKQIAPMAAELAAICDQIICTRFTTNPRAIAPQRLADSFTANTAANDGCESSTIAVACEDDPRVALERAIRSTTAGGTVLICGSFFLAGELRPVLLSMPDLHPLDQATLDRPPTDNGSSTTRPSGGESPASAVQFPTVEDPLPDPRIEA